MSKLSRFLTLAAVLAALSGCLPTNNFIKPNMMSNGGAGTGTAGNGLNGNANSDNAQPPCTLYDLNTPARSVCVSCYQTILSTRCPGKKTFSSCVDPAVQNGYVSLINQCISQSTLAGFVCTTTCSAGMVVNPQTCTCVMPSPIPSGAGLNVDVGQKNFGPPIVQATFPPSALFGIPSPSPAPVTSPTSCIGTLPLYLGVQNRGDTVFRLNQYGMPQPNPTNPMNAMAPGQAYLRNYKTPIELSTDQVAAHPGSNAFASIDFITGAKNEILGASAPTGGRIYFINTISGSNSSATSPAFSDGVPSAGTNGGSASAATWIAPNFTTRDVDGNVYVSDPLAHVVDVICNNPGGGGAAAPYTGASPFCQAIAPGTMVRIAGTTGQAGNSADATPGYQAKLNSPHGLAVDLTYNVYIADSANHVIHVVCGSNAGNLLAACNGNSKALFTIAGTNNVSATDGTHLNFPYGVDVTFGDIPAGSGFGAGTHVFVADYQNSRIVRCDWTGVFGGGANCTLTSMAGNGIPGFKDDGACDNTQDCVRYPTDVKVTWKANVLYADSRNHLIRAVCRNSGQGDACDQAAGPFPKVITVAGQKPVPLTSAGIPQAGDSGEGAAANTALITYPYQLLLSNQYSGDFGGNSGGAFPNFYDNNILFTERLLASTTVAGITTPTAIPASNGVGPVTGITNMAMGKNHTCVLNGAGNILCVGDNSVAQMGNSSGGVQPTLTQVSVGPNPGGQFGAGSFQTCTAAAGGTGGNCWGLNASGQLGNNTTTPTPGGSPVPITATPAGPTTGPTWGGFTGGDSHTCALNTAALLPAGTGNFDQAAWCWGTNNYGQLGTGAADSNAQHNYPAKKVDFSTTTPYTTAPAGVGLLASGTQLASGANHVCALVNKNVGGTTPTQYIYCWGNNSVGQLGLNSATPASLQAPTTQLVGVTTTTNADWMIAAGGDHTCAWETGNGNKLYCWGSNAKGEMGTGSVAAGGQLQAVQVPGIVVAGASQQSVALGMAHTCAITNVGGAATTGVIQCWGDNSFGQLGNDDVPNASTPLQVIGLPVGTISGVYAAGNQTCALIGGTPYCWGANKFFQLGSGATGVNPSGNTVRVICGKNTPGTPSVTGAGFCQGVAPPAPGKQGQLYTIAGSSGKYASQGAGDGGNARLSLFAKAAGVSFDLFKNLIVSSGGFVDSTGKAIGDYRLRAITNAVIGPKSGLKYYVIDSNGQTSFWCLRLKPLTYCDSKGVCTCAMVPPTDETDPNFWEAVDGMTAANCPGP